MPGTNPTTLVFIALIGSPVLTAIITIAANRANRRRGAARDTTRELDEARREKMMREIREQVLPGNGTKLWEYAESAMEAAQGAQVEAQSGKELGQQALFEQRRHLGLYRHERKLVEEDDYEREGGPG